jgi:hypothetical protein
MTDMLGSSGTSVTGVTPRDTWPGVTLIEGVHSRDTSRDTPGLSPHRGEPQMSRCRGAVRANSKSKGGGAIPGTLKTVDRSHHHAGIFFSPAWISSNLWAPCTARPAEIGHLRSPASELRGIISSRCFSRVAKGGRGGCNPYSFRSVDRCHRRACVVAKLRFFFLAPFDFVK